MEETEKIGLAVASMIFGIIGVLTFWIGFGFIFGIIAIILAGISLYKKEGGKGFAVAGLVLGIIAFVIGAVIGILLLLSMAVLGMNAFVM